MRNRLKRATAAVITAVMLLTLLSASLASGDGEILSAPVVPGLEDGGALLNQVQEQSNTDEGYITVTFVINNGDYTADPGSSETHLTVKAPIEGSELTYSEWADRYQVKGTGTICSYTIPAGSSLTAEGYTTPALTVENIGSNNTCSYSSAYSWVTAGGMVCKANTIFNESVTLCLQLYEDSSAYQLDFVCSEDENHSIKTVGSFLLGQSISAADIDAATAAAQEYTSQYCTHGVAHGETLTGWQLKVTSSDTLVDFSAGMAITSDYVNTDYGNAVKVYAVWTTVPVTATFAYGDTTVATRPLTYGDALGTLPDAPEATGDDEGLVFLGWQYTDSEDSTCYATAETVITADTVYTAVFGEPACYSVVFHDIQPNGDESGISIDLLVQEGMTLAQALAEYDAALEDGAMLSDCVWYTVDESGVRTAVDLAAPVTANMELYTYTYQIVLTLAPQTAAAAIATFALVNVTTEEDGTLTLTITAREGDTLTAADFVVDGVDYSLYAWTDEAGNSVDIQSLINNGVTENITATSTETQSNTKQIDINFYVCVDDVWQSTTQTMTAYWLNSSWFLTSAQLQSVYGKYGFTSMEAGNRFFPHSTTGDPYTLWGDRSTEKVGNVVYSPLVNSENATACNVYYIPKESVTYSSQRDNVKSANTFYTVTVIDPGQKVYTADTLPAVTYTLTGGEAFMTVEARDGVTWQCVGTNGDTVSGTANDDGTVTFTIDGIGQPYVISPVLADNEAMITYNINLPQPPADDEYGTPQIEGSDTYTVLANGEHTVLAPSLLSYFYNIPDDYTTDRYQGEVTFTGWKIEGTEEVLKPGDSLDWTQYGGTSITLLAQWTVKASGAGDEEKRGSMVNFFVSLSAVSEGTEAWSVNTAVNFYTSSVFSTDCGVTGTNAMNLHLYNGVPTNNQYFVLGGSSGDNLNEIHTTIVTQLKQGYSVPGTDGQTYTYSARFPSDEEVLRKIRAQMASTTNDDKRVKINNQVIPVDDFTTANFTIKWFVFKYDGSDGWHIDGILVAKTAELVVTKTFAGDQDAIEAVKNSYSIAVTGGSVKTYGSGLNLSDATKSGNTYTWTLDVDQYYDYTFTEQNYQYNANLCTSNALYRVRNSNTSGQNTGGWLSYNDGVTVTGQGHNEDDDERLTVSFLNTYTAPGTVILQKVDAATGNLMPKVSFTIAKDGENFTMYDKGNGHYSAVSGSGTATTTITTDSTGQAYLWIGGGTYTLQETVPTGYDDPGTITMKLEGEEGNNYKVISITSLEAQNGTKFVGKDDLTLKVKNYSRTINLRVTKNWVDNENKPVTLQLYRNGNPMGSSYTVTFDGSENWTQTFNGLPLYADGGLAQYTLREEALGDFKYSAEYSDGYQYYDVTYSGMSYLDASGSVTTDMSEVKTIALSVTNKRSSGAMTITKVDNFGAGVAGAVFHLYAAPNTDSSAPSQDDDGNWNVLSGRTPVKSTTSDANGAVNFGTVAAGRYYIVESSAPAGYTGSSALYSMQFDGTTGKLQVWNGQAWANVTGNSVVNTRNTASVTITKQVTGNMGDRNKAFEFTVTSDMAMGSGDGYTLENDGKTATFSLSHGEIVTLQNVPIGATLTVNETNAEDYTMTVTANGATDPLDSYTVVSGSNAITVENSKSATPDTGVFLDSLPYVVILGCVAVVIILLLARRRRDRDDR